MFLTSLSIADICGPAYLRRLAKTNEDPPPDPLMEHPAGVFTI